MTVTPCIRVKPGVKFGVIAPAGFAILAAVHAACWRLQTDLTISCGSEGHPTTDPHSEGAAFDLSVQGLNDPQIIELVMFLRHTLGQRFYATYETPGTPREALVIADVAVKNPQATSGHIHIQRARNTVYPPNTLAV